MGHYLKPKKKLLRLKARQNAYAQMCSKSKDGGKEYTKPGSLNK